jgi:hypothetical protein
MEPDMSRKHTLLPQHLLQPAVDIWKDGREDLQAQPRPECLRDGLATDSSAPLAANPLAASVSSLPLGRNQARLSRQPWSWESCCVWVVVAVLVALWQGPAFVKSLRPPRNYLCDFVQDWASARNWCEARPIYEDQERSLARYLDFRRDPNNPTDRWFLPVNAHPPTSVLLAVPLAWLDYPEAVLVWNLLSLLALAASLWLMNRQLLCTSSPWTILPLMTFLLLCGPFRQHVIQGQLTLVLLLLLTGAWVADRTNRPTLAGILVGTAMAIKLFPGFMLLYFLVRRQWKAVAMTALAFSALTGLTLGLAGTETYRDYISEVMPLVKGFEGSWLNASFAGFWSRLFNPATVEYHVRVLWPIPSLAQAGTLLCQLAVVVLLGWTVSLVRTRTERDLAFGLVMVGMMLVSPITWDHYFLLLILPVVLVWQCLPPRGAARWLFAFIPFIMSLNLGWFFDRCIPGGLLRGMAGPVEVLTWLALPFYALLALFIVGLAVLHSQIRVGRQACRRDPLPCPVRIP